MTTYETASVVLGGVLVIGGLITGYVAIMVRLSTLEISVAEHKAENNSSFNEIAKVLDKVSDLHYNVGLNSQRIVTITNQFNEHKEQNDKSFTMITDLVKQNRQDNKEEHNEMFKLIGEGQKQLTDLLIRKIG